MSRLFDGVDDSMVYNQGSVDPIDFSGGFTILMVVKIATAVDNSWQAFIENKSVSAVVRVSLLRRGTGNLAYVDGAGIDDVIPISDGDGWMIIATTKTSGSSIPTNHKAPIGGSRTSTALPEGARTAIGSMADGNTIIGGSTSDWANMYLALAAQFERVLSTTELDGILAAKTTESVIALGPHWCVDDSNGFASDLVGNIDRTTLVGTTDDADDPSGWVYGLASEKSGSAVLPGGGAQVIVKAKNAIATHS